MLPRVFPTIVRIEAIRLRPFDGHMTKAWTAGSGVIIAQGGYVLTNCHVTEDVDSFRCYLYDGEHVDAHRIGQDPMTDIAVLQMDLSQLRKDAPPLSVAVFGDSEKVASGDTVYALGSPGFLSQSVTRGIVSNPSLVLPEQTVGKMYLRGEDVGTLVRWILHDASIFGGNSGGPLINERGEIIGVNEIGVFNLSGAIPGNLARGIAQQLIKSGHVTRGWSGVTVQPRLEAEASDIGVEVSDVASGSPASKSDLRPGDIILACDGIPIEGAQERAVTHFYRLETGRMPGTEFSVDFLRGAVRKHTRMVLDVREAAESDDVEMREWGAIVRDLTPIVVREDLLPDRKGVMLVNIRPGGPSGQAEPELHNGDVIIALDGQPIDDVASMGSLSRSFFPDSDVDTTHPAIATVRRDGAVITTVIELRNTNPHRIAPSAQKAWLGVASQPLTPKLNKRMGINSEDGGARITRVYPGTEAEKAGLQVGDVLLALDGIPVAAQRPEDTEVLARQVRKYKIGTSANVSLWREGKAMELPVVMEAQPKPSAEMPLWDDEELEFEVRDLAFDDRTRLQLPASAKGVLVSSTTPSGWAELAGLRGDDLVIAAESTPISSVDELHRVRDETLKSGKRWLVLQVERRGESVFIEINLKSART
jgi:serine protease Do